MLSCERCGQVEASDAHSSAGRRLESGVIRDYRLIGHTSSTSQINVDTEIQKLLSKDLSKVKTVMESELHMQEEEIQKMIKEGGAGFKTITKVIKSEPRIIEGPDFSTITSFKHNPELIEEESERITKIIRGGGSLKRQAAGKSPGMKRRARLVRHPAKTSQ